MMRLLTLSVTALILLSGEVAHVRARNLYVSAGQSVRAFSLTGADRGSFVSFYTGFHGIELDDEGNLYAVHGGGDGLHPALRKFAPDGTPVSTLYTFPLEARISGALALDGDGNLYVSDDRACRFCGPTFYVHKFNPSGVDLGSFTPFLDSLLDLSIDSDGRLYVGQDVHVEDEDIVKMYGPDGADLGTIHPRLNILSGIAFDSAGNIYVSGNGGIRKLSPTGADLGMFVSGPSFRDLAFDDAGVLYAISVGEPTVRKFGPTGADLGAIVLPAPGRFLAFGPESDVPGGTPFDEAGPGDFAYLDGERPGSGVPLPPETLMYQALELLQGSSFTLDPHETLVLTAGPLYIGPGAVFTGNGIIQGNVINAGLLRIPIVRIPTIAQTTGGHVEIELPEPTAGVVVIDISGGGGALGVGGGTLLSFQFEDEPAPIVIQGDPAPNEGTIRFDASLEITGSYEQRETGALRLFIAGDDMPGVNYSQLTVGESVTLAGAIELVLQPELFGEFGYTPSVGDTFDLIVAQQGITIADSGLTLRNFSTQDGAPLIDNLTFNSYDSGIAADPDRLFKIGESIFRLDLAANNTILRATLIHPISFVVPEPSALLLAGMAVLATALRRRARY